MTLPSRRTLAPKPGHLHALRIAGLATYTTEFALWAIVALTIVHLVGWGRRAEDAMRFRWLGPTTAATTRRGVRDDVRLRVAAPVRRPQRRAGGRILATSFGIGTLALVAPGSACSSGSWSRKRRSCAGRVRTEPPFAVPAEPGGREGAELAGATPRLRHDRGEPGAVRGGRVRGTIALTVSALAFLISALYQFRFGQVRWLEWSVSARRARRHRRHGAILVFLIRNARKPNERRIVGIIWDVLTFWPRRYHPFGVRPYAERAVPRSRQDGGVVRAEDRVSCCPCHSQGTVLGYAALVQLPDDVAGQMAFVTSARRCASSTRWRSPLSSRRRASWRSAVKAVRRRPKPSASWRGFYRLTDYIGKTVFEDPAFEEIVPDPAMGRRGRGAVGPTVGPAFPDTPRDHMDGAAAALVSTTGRRAEGVAPRPGGGWATRLAADD